MLWGYRCDKTSIIKDGSSEVMVVNCGCSNRFNIIPAEWNCEDWNAANWKIEDAKLIHFTDLKSQPWFGGTKYPELAKIWFDLEKEALEANTQ